MHPLLRTHLGDPPANERVEMPPQRAEETVRNLLGSDPDSDYFHYLLASALEKQEKTEDAAEALKRAIALC